MAEIKDLKKLKIAAEARLNKGASLSQAPNNCITLTSDPTPAS